MANSLASLSGRPAEPAPQQTPEQPEDTRVFMFRLDGEEVVSHLFNHKDDIPEDEGWVDSPTKAKGEGKPSKPAPTRHQRRQHHADLE